MSRIYGFVRSTVRRRFVCWKTCGIAPSTSDERHIRRRTRDDETKVDATDRNISCGAQVRSANLQLRVAPPSLGKSKNGEFADLFRQDGFIRSGTMTSFGHRN